MKMLIGTIAICLGWLCSFGALAEENGAGALSTFLSRLILFRTALIGRRWPSIGVINLPTVVSRPILQAV